MSFSHLDAGTPESDWADAAPWTGAATLDLDDVDRLVVVAAHPDDETLGAGGLIATAAARGIRVAVVIGSDGEASHPSSPTVTPAALAARRRTEVVDAVGALASGVDVRLLGLPDGRLGEHRERLRDAVAAAIGGTATVVVGTWEHDRHPDHVAVALAVEAAARKSGARALAYPVWAWHWSAPGDHALPFADAVVLPLAAEAREAKRRALALHASQNEPLSDAPGDEAILPARFREHFDRDVEILLPVAAIDGDGAARIGGRTVGGHERGDLRADASASEGAPSLDASFFADFYGDEPDPWGFETRWYEERKRATTLAALPRARFRSALELGCSIGVLTSELAPRVDRLVATDVAEQALARARARLGGVPGVELVSGMLPGDWPDGSFELIVVSEVAYYLSTDDLTALAGRIRASLEPDGVVVSCHWRHPVDEYPLGGDEAAGILRGALRLPRLVVHEERDFLLEVFDASDRSVAQATGLAD